MATEPECDCYVNAQFFVPKCAWKNTKRRCEEAHLTLMHALARILWLFCDSCICLYLWCVGIEQQKALDEPVEN